MRWIVRVVHFLPNALTLTTLFLGCIAVVYMLESAQLFVIEDWVRLKVELKPSATDWGLVMSATWLVFIGIVLDFLDGWVARLLGAASEVGRMLDALADLIMFGLVPSLVLYRLLGASYRLEGSVPPSEEWWYWLPFVYVVGASYRLARFNAEGQDKRLSYFVGLPTPAAALIVVAYFYLVYFEVGWRKWLFSSWHVLGLTFLLALLMVSRVPMLSLKFQREPIRVFWWLRVGFWALSLVWVVIVGVVVGRWWWVPAGIVLTYGLLTGVMWVGMRFVSGGQGEEELLSSSAFSAQRQYLEN